MQARKSRLNLDIFSKDLDLIDYSNYVIVFCKKNILLYYLV